MNNLLQKPLLSNIIRKLEICELSTAELEELEWDFQNILNGRERAHKWTKMISENNSEEISSLTNSRSQEERMESKNENLKWVLCLGDRRETWAIWMTSAIHRHEKNVSDVQCLAVSNLNTQQHTRMLNVQKSTRQRNEVVTCCNRSGNYSASGRTCPKFVQKTNPTQFTKLRNQILQFLLVQV